MPFYGTLQHHKTYFHSCFCLFFLLFLCISLQLFFIYRNILGTRPSLCSVNFAPSDPVCPYKKHMHDGKLPCQWNGMWVSVYPWPVSQDILRPECFSAMLLEIERSGRAGRADHRFKISCLMFEKHQSCLWSFNCVNVCPSMLVLGMFDFPVWTERLSNSRSGLYPDFVQFILSCLLAHCKMFPTYWFHRKVQCMQLTVPHPWY